MLSVNVDVVRVQKCHAASIWMVILCYVVSLRCFEVSFVLVWCSKMKLSVV